MKKVYKVWVNGEKVEKTYEEISRDLGFIPSVHFVCITPANTITFYVGKPDEVKALLYACYQKGYKPAKSLINVARNA